MLTVKFINDGTGTNESANYEWWVRVNGREVATGYVRGHDQTEGWQGLVRMLGALGVQDIEGIVDCGCRFSDPWRCAVARGLTDRIACDCPCHKNRIIWHPRIRQG